MSQKSENHAQTDSSNSVNPAEFELVEGERRGWEAYETEEVILAVHERLAYQLFFQAWVHNLGSIVVACCAAIATWRVEEHSFLIAWLIVFIFIYCCRWVISYKFHQTKPRGTAIYKWVRLQFGAIIASALAYSAPVIFLWPEEAPLEQMVWVITLTATPAAAVARYSVWKYADLPFVYLTLLPIVVRLFFNHGLPYTMLGILGTIYGLTLLQIGKVMYKTNLENLLTGVKNQQLNQLLAGEVEERERTYALLRKQEQELAQAKQMESIGTLSSGVAHEINTPLQFISSNLHFIASGVKTFKGYVSRISSLEKSHGHEGENSCWCHKVSALRNEYDIDYFLDEMSQAKLDSDEGVMRISKIVEALQLHAGSETAAIKTVNFNESVDHVVLLSHHLWQDVCRVEKQYDEDLPNIHCNAKEFNQVIMGLLVNAIQAVQNKKKLEPHFEGLVHIRTGYTEDTVCLFLSDNGIGFPPHLNGRPLDDLCREKFTDSTVGQGLSFAHRVINNFEGHIDINSQVNVGTTIRITIPAYS